MSEAIRNVEKLNARQIEAVKRRGEREIKSIENAHQNIKAEQKKAHASEIVDIEHNHHHHINQQAAKKEKILAEMRDHLQQTKTLTEKELKELKNNTETQKAAHQTKLSLERERLNADNSLYLEELSDRFDREARKVHIDGQNRIESTKLEKQEQLTEVESYNQKKLNQQRNEFNTRFSEDSRNFEKIKTDQDNQFKKERMATNQRQQIDMQKLTDTHNIHVEQKDEHYRKGLKEQDLFFEKKYETQLSRHNSEFKALEQKNNDVIEKLKSSLTSEISHIASKNDDPFYKFEALAPRLKETKDGVEISLEIPEHSKEAVTLSFNGKEAIIALNRRYHDANKTQDGTINKVNKVESFTTRIKTADILDPKSVKTSYDDGTMTFSVKKA